MKTINSNQLFSFFIHIFLAFQLSACNVFYKEKTQLHNPDNAQSLVDISYATLAQKVFVPKCLQCHQGPQASGGVRLETYLDVRRNLEAIDRTVLHERSMPKDDRLSDDQFNLLSTWIKQGAPEISDGELPGPQQEVPPPPVPPPPPVSPEPVEPPPPPVLLPTFQSIRTLIFESKCIRCHISTGSAKRVPLSDYGDLINSPLDLVLPNQVEISGLWISITRTDKKRMPPASTGMTLSDDELTVIRKWIETGAPE